MPSGHHKCSHLLPSSLSNMLGKVCVSWVHPSSERLKALPSVTAAHRKQQNHTAWKERCVCVDFSLPEQQHVERGRTGWK